ncbi:MAG: plastocyanin/azurin family copper-binding protein [Thermomicrobiales bacterium]
MPNPPTDPDPVRPSPDLVAASRALARADAETARRKRARARVYRRGGYLMIGLIALTALLSVVYVVANRHETAEAEKGLVFVIPQGASANVEVPTIDSAIAIPTQITFAKGEPAILSIRNEDTVANRAGPWVIGPGQTYTAKFDEPGTYEYVCTVDASESVTIVVEGDQ